LLTLTVQMMLVAMSCVGQLICDMAADMAKVLDSYCAAEGKFPDQFVLPRGEA
jgi:hypothetical protein